MNAPDAPDPRKVAEAALDVLVYAPVGLALEARELLPKLVERGRNQVVLARLGARFAVQRAEAEAEKLLARLQPEAAPAEPVRRPDPTAARDVPATPPTPAPAPATTATKAAPKAKATSAPKAKAARTTTAGGDDGAVVGLPIPGYDTLSASQVVPRLDALRPAELEAVRVHEVAHRGRRTILSRIAQLQG